MVTALPQEQELVRRANAGDGVAFEGIFALHGEALLNIGCAVLGNPDDAEDALQDVVLRVLANLPRFDARRPLRPWLRRMMVNECLSRLRRHRETDCVTDDLVRAPDSPHDASVEAESIRRVRASLMKLPPRQRAAITLFGLDGMDLRETAQAMGCSQGAVKAHLHRARRKLELELADLLDLEG